MTLTNICSNDRIKVRYLREFGKKEGTVNERENLERKIDRADKYI